MITLIDCDGVLTNFAKMAQDLVKAEFNIDIPLTDGKNWDFFDYPEIKSIKIQIWDRILNTRGLIRGLEKFQYTDEFLRKLREISTEVICVTAVPNGGYFADERMNYLIEELGFSKNDIILGYRKYLVQGDIFIDDMPWNVIQWADYWEPKKGLPILWQPPGRELKLDDPRVFCTGEMDTLIRYLKYIGKVRK